MKCYECGFPKISKNRYGERRCPRCGTKAGKPAAVVARKSEQPSLVVKVFTLTFALFALTFPFLVPLLLKVSLANPDAVWFF